jgi:NADPH-dependent 2,4-dienoyl-CoA reductase/sulfur reductase-like enzyme
MERLVVIGGDAAGMAAASNARRRRGPDDLEIVALEKGRWTSYSACGIPYVLGGDVDGMERLVVRSPEEFRERYGIDARTLSEATAVDLDGGTVEVRDAVRGSTYRLGFDQLLVATGARPRRPDLPGVDSADVHGVQTLEDGYAVLERAKAGHVRNVVVIGGGYIGLEVAEAFAKRGCGTTVVEQAPEVMGTLDPDMGALVGSAMRAAGITVRCGEAVVGFEPGRVLTEAGPLPADVVILGMGVVPDAGLAERAGVGLGATGAVAVDDRQRTDRAGVWAAGDCCESLHLVSGRKVHAALGTVANKQGRVAGINLGGGDATFPGVLGTAVTRVCRTEVARTGLNSAQAAEDGLLAETAKVEASTRAGYFPGAEPLTVKVLAERGTARLLGAQIVGGEGAAKRIDVFAAALAAEMTVDRLVNLDLSYAPPFGPVWDPVLLAARRAWGKLEPV